MCRIWRHPANRGKRLRRLGAAVRFQLRGRILRRRTLTRLGRRSLLWAELHVPTSSAVVYANPPDWPEMQTWARVLGSGDLFVDVGANIGAYTLWAGEQGAEVLAIEPHPGARSRLLENVELNHYPVQVIAAALGDTARTGLLTHDLGPQNRLLLEPGGEGLPVDVITLDELLGDRTAAGVKIDVEGAERLVLAGAARALREQRIALLQLEWNPASLAVLREDRTPVAALLRNADYELLRPDGSGHLHLISDIGFGPDVFAAPRGRNRHD